MELWDVGSTLIILWWRSWGFKLQQLFKKHTCVIQNVWWNLLTCLKNLLSSWKTVNRLENILNYFWIHFELLVGSQKNKFQVTSLANTFVSKLRTLKSLFWWLSEFYTYCVQVLKSYKGLPCPAIQGEIKYNILIFSIEINNEQY